MDPLYLLTRASKTSKGHRPRPQHVAKSTSPITPADQPQASGALKRKRNHESTTQQTQPITQPQAGPIDFFSGKILENGPLESDVQATTAAEATIATEPSAGYKPLDTTQIRGLYKRHKLKIVILNPGDTTNGASDDSSKHKSAKSPKIAKKDTASKHNDSSSKHLTEGQQLFPEPLRDFSDLSARFAISRRLARNILEQGYRAPTEVQMAGIPLLLDTLSCLDFDAGDADTHDRNPQRSCQHDLLTVAPTGSGKTLAFLVPLLQQLLNDRAKTESDSDDKKVRAGPRAVILAPTKELARQITNEGRKLAAGIGLRVAYVKKGMVIGENSDTDVPAVKADILVSTPLTLANALPDHDGKAGSQLESIQYLVLDEADVLLDPLFREQTLSIWNAMSSVDLRVSLWSATIGSNIEELVQDIIASRTARLQSINNDVRISRAPLIRLVVGLKDSAVSNVEHRLTFAASEQGKLLALRQLIHPTGVSIDDKQKALAAPFLVFVQTIERATALHAELKYDIPIQAGGATRIAVLHSKLSDSMRDSIMTRFRAGEIWVLITTDLLSRGVDFRGVNAVVNYDVPTSSAAYIHRAGRTGRAGRAGGVAVTLYTTEDVPYIKCVVNVIAASQSKAKSEEVGKDVRETGVQQWLLDALPNVSKADKKTLKKRGVEARRSNPVVHDKDGHDGKRLAAARISTKTGYDRQLANKRKGAISASKSRPEDGAGQVREDSASEDNFAGFE